MRSPTFVVLAISLAQVACTKPSPQAESVAAKTPAPSLDSALEKIRGDETIGSYRAQAFTNIHFGGQPTEADLETLAAEGFTTIISLRGPGEYDLAAQQSKSGSLGMHYAHLPFEKGSSLTDGWIDAVTQAVVARRQTGKILVHCASGNRAGLWAGAHFHKDHGLSQGDATVVGRKLGMRDAALPILEAYFAR